MTIDRVRLLGAALAGLTLLSVPAALALPTYRKQAAQQFRYDRDNPMWALDRRVVPCTYCHVRATGGAPWNPFGEAIRAAFRADAQAGKHSKFSMVLHGLLKADKDADEDGYSDALEVFTRTLPGDEMSYPSATEKDLRAAFEKAGGAQQYLPLRSKK